MTEANKWKPLWAVFTPNGYPLPKDGYRIEYLHSDYDGSAIKYRYIKND